MNFIYSLTIDETPFYIGKTDNIDIVCHSLHSYYESFIYLRGGSYKDGLFHDKLLRYIKNLYFITTDNMFDYIKVNVLYDNIPDNYINQMKYFVIHNYQCYDLQNIQHSQCSHNTTFLKCKMCNGLMCPYCDKVYSNMGIKQHFKRCKMA